MHDQHPDFLVTSILGVQSSEVFRASQQVNNYQLDHGLRLSMKMKRIMQVEEGFTPPLSVQPIHTKSNPIVIFLFIQNICYLKTRFPRSL